MKFQEYLLTEFWNNKVFYILIIKVLFFGYERKAEPVLLGCRLVISWANILT